MRLGPLRFTDNCTFDMRKWGCSFHNIDSYGTGSYFDLGFEIARDKFFQTLHINARARSASSVIMRCSSEAVKICGRP